MRIGIIEKLKVFVYAFVRHALGALLVCASPAFNESSSDWDLSAPPLSVSAARIEAFRQRLRELGYVEGNNILIEWRSAEGKSDRLPALVAELVQLNADVIVTAGPSVTRPAMMQG